MWRKGFLENEGFIWRPLMAGKVTMAEMNSGLVSLGDLMVINALLDHEEAQAAAERRKAEKARAK